MTRRRPGFNRTAPPVTKCLEAFEMKRHILPVSYFAILITALLTPSQAPAADPGTIHFEITDEHANPVSCRVHVFNFDDMPQAPDGLPTWNDHFVCRGKATLHVAAGEFRWQVERGPEHERASGTVKVSTGRTTSVRLTLRRIVNLKNEHWYSGDLHVHRPASDLTLLMRAEDLDVAPVIEWWNNGGTNLAELQQTVRNFDRHRIYELRGGEDEREGGALLYFGLNAPLDIQTTSREFPSPLQFVAAARSQNPDVWIDIEKPFWWDVPTWLASGQMNSIGLANNHMCRSRMYENEAWGKPRDVSRLPNPTGNGFWSQEIYYHILNSGLRLPPSAGSASGVLPNPVGYNRVYVHLDHKPLSRAAWFQGLADGRCFVTNGPLLRATAAGQHSGHVFRLPQEGALSIDLSARLTSEDPVRELEVIHNGQIIQRIRCSPLRSQQLASSIRISEPGWFLLRAVTDVESTFRFASTAPWYVDGPDGQQRISKESATFFLKWVDERIGRIRNNITNAQELREVLEPHEQARVFWQHKIDQANSENTIPVARTSVRVREATSVREVEVQPLLASIRRLSNAMDYLGSPLPESVKAELLTLNPTEDPQHITARVQELLDPHCLAMVSLRKKGPPMVKPGTARRELLEQGWRTFLIKVVNKPGHTTRLLVESPNAQPLPHSPADQVPSRWMQLAPFEGRPLKPNLSGLELEYRIVQIYSRDSGTKHALLEFTVSNKAGDDGELIREWRFTDDTDGWREMSQIEMAVRDGSLHVTSSGDDPFMGADICAPAGPMVLRFWAKSEVDGVGQLFWWTKEVPQPTAERQTNFLLKPGQEHMYEVPFQSNSQLAGIRLDPTVKPGAMRIDWIDLYSARRSANWTRLPLEFESLPATRVTLRVIDAEGLPAFARFEISDSEGRIYPAQSKRLAPDFFFQKQIYRGDGETIALPPGTYTVKCSRGPETIPQTKELVVNRNPTELVYRVDRWIDPSREGWWSGDHHIHAAGCLHYQNPTEGVEPNDMIRHIMGEDLKVGCCLTWGPCFDFQKRFFTGDIAEQSQYPYTLRYDVEVSGFGSHSSGHLNLLNLKEQIYPGGESKDHWPTLGLNTLRWAKKQGAVCGPAHSSIGLDRMIGRLPNTDGRDGQHRLPNYDIPAFDGIGANEFIVDVTHTVPGSDGRLVPAVDFISTMNTQRVAEWNMWYHVLNCGFRVTASGETDFPCMSGERVGIGRVYAKVDGRLDFRKWVKSISEGRCYVSDGRCHLMNFQGSTGGSASSTAMGEGGSEVKLSSAGSVSFSLDSAALIDGSKDLPVELVINGYPVARKTMKADGTVRNMTFQHEFTKSGWAAVRVFPHAHTNPIYVVVGDLPVQGTVDSARWCLAGVEQCWKSKQNTYATDEQDDARAAYDHARRVYQELIRTHPDSK